MSAKYERISIEQLKGIEILFEDDLYQLGQLMLQGYDAVGAEAGYVGRPTPHGLASSFAMLFHESSITSKQVEETIRRAGLPLGATIEHDRDCRPGRATGAPRQLRSLRGGESAQSEEKR